VSVEQNKAIARRFIEEVCNKGHIAVAHELLAPDLVNHRADGSTTNGRDAFEKFIGEFRAASPGLAFTIEDMLGEDDKVATRVTVRIGDALWTGIGIIKVADGRIVEQWADTERAGTAKPSSLA
jgi:predicted SnoaL-like aldol condensation-catalyzing enzyme